MIPFKAKPWGIAKTVPQQGIDGKIKPKYNNALGYYTFDDS